MYRQGMTFLPTGAGLQEPGPGSDPEGGKPLEKPPENLPENQLEISYTGKSPKIGSLDMS